MKHFASFFCILSLFFVSATANYASAAQGNEKPRSNRNANSITGAMPQQIENYVDTSDPKSLWYGYGEKHNREMNVFPVVIPKGDPVVSKKYNPKAYPHLKNMAVYCNQQWRNQNCLRRLSALGIALTKDYMKKIYKSNTAPEDLKMPAQKTLREACSGIVMRPKEEIIPMVMSDNLKVCINAITAISKLTKEYPDHDLRQLTLSSTFCIIRQPRCDVIEGQLNMIAKPKKKETEEVAPVK